MKAYKLEILVIDYDEIGGDAIQAEIENANYGNDCITPRVKHITERDIGPWNDDHPLNDRKTCDQEYERLFNEDKAKQT